MSLQTKVIGRTPTDHGSYNPNTSYGKKFCVTLFGCMWESLHDNNNTAPAVWDGGDTITPNLVDWKKVSGDYNAWLMNRDKPAASEQYPFNGMGRIRLQKNLVEVEEGGEIVTKNLLTQAMFEDGDGNPLTNTVYVIQYDYTLGEDVTVPENCVLEFEGGSINSISYNVIFQTTELVGNIKINCPFSGSVSNKEVHTSWFCKMDGTSDETDNIQNAINVTPSLLVIDKGVYNVTTKEAKRLELKSNLTVSFAESAILEGINENEDIGSLLRIDNVTNVHVVGGELYGDFETNTSTTEGGLHGLLIKNSSNIIIENMYCHHNYTDNCYIRASENVMVSNCRFDYSGRGGLTITSGKNITVDNCIAAHATKNAPMHGFGIETNYTTDILENIVIKECVSYDNTGSPFYINIDKNKTYNSPINVTFDNCIGHKGSFWLGSSTPTDKLKGRVLINNFTSIDSPGNIFISGVSDINKSIPVIINNPIVINGNTEGWTNTYGYFYNQQYTDENVKHGNIKFVNVDFTDARNTIRNLNPQINSLISVIGGSFTGTVNRGNIIFDGDFPSDSVTYNVHDTKSLNQRHIIFDTSENAISSFQFRTDIGKGTETLIEKKGSNSLSFRFIGLTIANKNGTLGGVITCNSTYAFMKLRWTDTNVAYVTEISKESDWTFA